MVVLKYCIMVPEKMQCTAILSRVELCGVVCPPLALSKRLIRYQNYIDQSINQSVSQSTNTQSNAILQGIREETTELQEFLMLACLVGWLVKRIAKATGFYWVAYHECWMGRVCLQCIEDDYYTTNFTPSTLLSQVILTCEASDI
jgi:hypothetical protein